MLPNTTLGDWESTFKLFCVYTENFLKYKIFLGVLSTVWASLSDFHFLSTVYHIGNFSNVLDSKRAPSFFSSSECLLISQTSVEEEIRSTTLAKRVSQAARTGKESASNAAAVGDVQSEPIHSYLNAKVDSLHFKGLTLFTNRERRTGMLIPAIS